MLQILCAVHVPEHIGACQVPDPDVPLRRPDPTARLMPLTSVTLILPASATRPEALTPELADATWPLLMSIATLAPLPQAEFDEAICTFHSPSKPAAEACVAKGIASSTRMRAAIVSLRKCPMVLPPVFLDTATFTQRRAPCCERSHADKRANKSPAGAGLCIRCRRTGFRLERDGIRLNRHRALGF